MDNLSTIKGSDFLLHQTLAEVQRTREDLLAELRSAGKAVFDKIVATVIPPLLGAGLSAAVIIGIVQGNFWLGVRVAGLVIIGVIVFVLFWQIGKRVVASLSQLFKGRNPAPVAPDQDKLKVQLSRFNDVTVNQALAASTFAEHARKRLAETAVQDNDAYVRVCLGESLMYLKKCLYELAPLVRLESTYGKISVGDRYRIESVLQLLTELAASLQTLFATAPLSEESQATLLKDLAVLRAQYLDQYVRDTDSWRRAVVDG